MSYTLHILEDDQFDALPYKDVKDALGCADAKKGVAFVRRTGVKGIDRNTLEHELDELMQKVSPHEEDGIRYKKGGMLRNIVPALLAFIPGVGPLLAAASNVGMSQYAKSVHPEQLGAPGKFGDIVGSAATGYFGGKSAQGAMAGFKNAGPGFLSKATGTLKGAVGLGATKAATSMTPQALAKATTAGVGLPSIGTTTSAAVTAASQPYLASAAATSSLGTKLKTANKMMDVANNSGVTQKFAQSLAGAPVADVGDFGDMSGSLSRFGVPGLNTNYNINAPEINESELNEGYANIDRNAAQRTANVFGQFRGQDPDGNSAFAKSLANVGVSTNKEKDAFRNDANNVNSQRYHRQELMKLNGLDDSTFDKYLNLAKTGTDEQISSMFGQDPNDFRSVFKAFL